MKRTKIIISVAIISATIALGAILSSKAYAVIPNCWTNVGNITIECYGSTSSLCITIYEGGEPKECKGSEVVIIHIDDPQ